MLADGVGLDGKITERFNLEMKAMKIWDALRWLKIGFNG
jgi:hypothetical protein